LKEKKEKNIQQIILIFKQNFNLIKSICFNKYCKNKERTKNAKSHINHHYLVGIQESPKMHEILDKMY